MDQVMDKNRYKTTVTCFCMSVEENGTEEREVDIVKSLRRQKG